MWLGLFKAATHTSLTHTQKPYTKNKNTKTGHQDGDRAGGGVQARQHDAVPRLRHQVPAHAPPGAPDGARVQDALQGGAPVDGDGVERVCRRGLGLVLLSPFVPSFFFCVARAAARCVKREAAARNSLNVAGKKQTTTMENEEQLLTKV